MSFDIAAHSLWTREINRVMTHAMYRAHVGNEQDVEMLRSLNDYYDLQTPQTALSTLAPSPERSPTPPALAFSVSPEPPPVMSATPTQLQFMVNRTPSLMGDVLNRPQHPSWLPDASSAAAFVVLCDERTAVGSNEANARIEALYLICAGEPISRVLQHSSFSYQCLRSMCLTLKRQGAENYLQQLIRRY